jgi:hypothetical protein
MAATRAAERGAPAAEFAIPSGREQPVERDLFAVTADGFLTMV